MSAAVTAALFPLPLVSRIAPPLFVAISSCPPTVLSTALPPPKYGYWTRKGKAPKDPEKWLETATPVPGSWWPEWAGWLSRHGGGQVPARVPGDRALAVIEDAPGRYVKVKSSE